MGGGAADPISRRHSPLALANTSPIFIRPSPCVRLSAHLSGGRAASLPLSVSPRCHVFCPVEPALATSHVPRLEAGGSGAGGASGAAGSGTAVCGAGCSIPCASSAGWAGGVSRGGAGAYACPWSTAGDGVAGGAPYGGAGGTGAVLYGGGAE